jgi:hypothetical protein
MGGPFSSLRDWTRLSFLIIIIMQFQVRYPHAPATLVQPSATGCPSDRSSVCTSTRSQRTNWKRSGWSLVLRFRATLIVGSWLLLLRWLLSLMLPCRSSQHSQCSPDAHRRRRPTFSSPRSSPTRWCVQFTAQISPRCQPPF